MKPLTKITLATVITFGALGLSTAFADDRDIDRIKLQLRDASCLDQAEAPLADATLTADQVQQRLRDGPCLLDDTAVDDTVAVVTPRQTRTRTRSGEDNGNSSVKRARTEGGGRN